MTAYGRLASQPSGAFARSPRTAIWGPVAGATVGVEVSDGVVVVEGAPDSDASGSSGVSALEPQPTSTIVRPRTPAASELLREVVRTVTGFRLPRCDGCHVQDTMA